MTFLPSMLTHRLKDVYFSFPFQLLVVHIRHNPILLGFWAVLFAYVTRNWGLTFGIPFLFLDPEYRGQNDFFAFFQLGLSYGAFVMAFQLASYTSNSRRFPFLASLSKPFIHYTLNNSLIPLVFLIVFCFSAARFQFENQFESAPVIAINLVGFLLGLALLVAITLGYFFRFSKDVSHFLGLNRRRRRGLHDALSPQLIYSSPGSVGISRRNRITYYLSGRLKVRLARETEHYHSEILEKVFRQNHVSAAVYSFSLIVVIFFIGFFRDFSYVFIPAGASILLVLTLFLMTAAALQAWFGNWTAFFSLLFFWVLNDLSSLPVFQYKGSLTELSNTPKVDLRNFVSSSKSTSKGVQDDLLHAQKVLSNRVNSAWRPQNQKPAIVFINASGGGLKLALWTFRALSYADSLTQGRLFQNTVLISGSSGGMIGAAYYRELQLQKLLDPRRPFQSNASSESLAKDLLNPVILAFTVNDMLIPFRKTTIGSVQLFRDRGDEFERALNENTGGAFTKTLGDYYQPEFNGLIPLMVFSPTIINDGRRLLISSQPVRFLTHSADRKNGFRFHFEDDVEFSRVFRMNGAEKLPMSSVVRMSATFPYVLPSVRLPSEPAIEVMDAGFMDNYGLRNTYRFLYSLRSWINQNCSEVIVLQFRENPSHPEIRELEANSLLNKLFSPLGNVYENLFRVQEHGHEEMAMYFSDLLSVPVVYHDFCLGSGTDQSEQAVSLSLHLTRKEKDRIRNAVFSEGNQRIFRNLKQRFGNSSGN